MLLREKQRKEIMSPQPESGFIHPPHDESIHLDHHPVLVEPVILELQEAESHIGGKVQALGGEGVLGAHTTDVTPTPHGSGFFVQHFQNGWSIYWSPQTDAHEVHGAIRDKWTALGSERSFLGFPVTDEMDNPNRNKSGRYSRFQGGFISWTPDMGAQEHRDGTTVVFSVDSIFIHTTRSGSIFGTATDTDVVALQMNIGSQAIGPIFRNLGDLKGGAHTVNFSISALVDDPAATVVMSFQINNSAAGDTVQLREASKKGFDSLAAAGIGAAVGAIGGPVGAAIGALLGAVGGAVGSILFANCDGLVAADTIHVSGATLNDETATGSHSETKEYPGLASPHGCGDNSLYSVTWSVTQQV
jgi:hypothetical protein